MSSGLHLNVIDLLLPKCAKRREKETEILITHKTLSKRILSSKKKYQLRHNVNKHLKF